MERFDPEHGSWTVHTLAMIALMLIVSGIALSPLLMLLAAFRRMPAPPG